MRQTNRFGGCQLKPAGLARCYPAQFCDESVADAYRHRPPHPAELFELLVRLIAHDGRPGRVLDVGCGRGEVARELVGRPEIAGVDAIDVSPAMIERGRALPNGNDPRLRWICSDIESARLDGPYALITAGSSLHWMDWSAVMPKLGGALTLVGVLAIFDDNAMPQPWDAELFRLIPRFSTNHDFTPYDLIEELTRPNLLTVLDRQTTTPCDAFVQPIDDYIEAAHSRNGFSRQRMSPAAAREFDGHLRRIIAPHAPNGLVRLRPISTVDVGPAVRDVTKMQSSGAAECASIRRSVSR